MQSVHKIPTMKHFIDAFCDKCVNYLRGNQVLNSRMVSRVKGALEPGAIVNFLGGIIPLPGADLVAGVLAAGLDMMVEKQEQAKRDQYFKHNSSEDLPREFHKLAYSLSMRYENALQELSEVGAQSFGNYCAEKVNEFLCSDSLKSNESFIKIF
jgi:hypothetical protein